MTETLPIHAVLTDVKAALHESGQLILQAPPGAGKTTIVPLELLDAPWLGNNKIVMLEPRRLAARNAANRMAELLGERVGERVGYRIRQETKVSADTRIEVVTEGILTRMLQSDPALEGIGVLIFDEFHERSLHADLGLALALQSQQLLRDDLKIIVMSATLNAKAVQGVMPDAPVITSKGRSFPVTYRYLDNNVKQPDSRTVVSLAVDAVMSAVKTEQGSILVFLPGVREIREAETRLRDAVGPEYVIAPLYGDLSKDAQQQAIAPAPEGVRKVVLATNIAETSLTIEGVRIVIDSGLERAVHYDSDSGMNRMRTQRITQDSATQRAGRAGRTQSGVCYRLWHENSALVPHARAEIVRSDLAPVLLELSKWGTSVDELAWVDRPPEHAESEARALLISLDMITADGRITEHGEAALKLGMHPRLAHMVLRAQHEGIGYEAVLIATLLQENTGIRAVDIAEGMERLSTLLSNMKAGAAIRRSVRDLCKRLDIVARCTVDTSHAGVLVALAYPDRIARRRGAGSEHFIMANGKGVVLGDDAQFVGMEYLAVAEAGGAESALRLFHAASLSQESIETWFADKIESVNEVVWNDAAGRVEARRIRRIGAVVLEKSRIDSPSPHEVTLGLLDGIRQRGLDVLPWDKKSLSLRARMTFASVHMPERFTAMDDATLLETLEAWLQPYLEDIRDLKGLQRLDMHAIISARAGWDALQELDELAPETLTVPSGSKIRIDYSDPHQPVLAVRLQEMFGQHHTPTVLKGSVPLMLHLLSPAQRPVQVTQDLVSFWNSGYAEVRKELRGKYKKHYWPEDPYEAVATSKTKKRM
jgi:ATP-dependent helicase HrpB